MFVFGDILGTQSQNSYSAQKRLTKMMLGNADPPLNGKKIEQKCNLWQEDEILMLLKIFRDNSCVDLLSNEQIKSEDIFLGVDHQMAAFGYSKKNYQQMWKFLKCTYITSRQANVIPKVITSKTYMSLTNLLSETYDMHYQHKPVLFEDDDGEPAMVNIPNLSAQNTQEAGYVKSEHSDIDEFHLQTQEVEIVSNNHQHKTSTVKISMNASGQLPVLPKIFFQPRNTKMKAVPLKKDYSNLKNSHKMEPKPFIAHKVSKLSFKSSISHISTHSEFERSRQPSAESQKIHEASSAAKSSIKSMEDMQKGLIADFFKKQKELVTEEFEFQRKQDEIMLKSFDDQNRALLDATRKLIEGIPSNAYL